MRHSRHILTLLEQNTGGVHHHFRVNRQGVQRYQGFGPLYTFGNAGRALKGVGKRCAAQLVDKCGHLG